MYGKIFESIFDSTLCSDGGWLPTYIFMSMISLADKDGIVAMAPKALWRRLGFREWDSKIQYTDFLKAIQFLESEDPESNTPDHQGRRIIPLSEIDEFPDNRGWFIVNYKLYRQKASKTEPKGSSTDRVRRFRERQKNQQLNSDETVLKRDETNCNGHTDTDTDNNINMFNSDEFEQVWNLVRKKQNKKRSFKAFNKLTKANKQKLIDYLKSDHYKSKPQQYTPLLSSIINGELWNDEDSQTPRRDDFAY